MQLPPVIPTPAIQEFLFRLLGLGVSVQITRLECHQPEDVGSELMIECRFKFLEVGRRIVALITECSIGRVNEGSNFAFSKHIDSHMIWVGEGSEMPEYLKSY
jgi:hypothetical protein